MQIDIRHASASVNLLTHLFKEAPKPHPARTLIKGVICGLRVEEIQDPLMREIRYLDKLVDELAKGKSMDKVLRPPVTP